MTQTQTMRPKTDLTGYLVRVAIILLLINFLLIFLPFVEVYQPSYTKTTLEGKTYEGWYTESASPVMFVVPVLITGIPYLCYIISLFVALNKKTDKNSFLKLKSKTLTKPLHFAWLKVAAIANVITLGIVFLILKGEMDYLEKYGAYCRMTFWGVLNILCSVAFVVLLFVLSRMTSKMFKLVRTAQPVTAEATEMPATAAAAQTATTDTIDKENTVNEEESKI